MNYANQRNVSKRKIKKQKKSKKVLTYKSLFVIVYNGFLEKKPGNKFDLKKQKSC